MVVEEPGKGDPEQEAQPIKDRGPEDGFADGVSFEPAAGRDGACQADEGCHRAQQTDLQAGGSEPRSVDVQEVDGAAAQDAKPAYIEIEVGKVGAVFAGNGWVVEQAADEDHGPDYNCLMLSTIFRNISTTAGSKYLPACSRM